MGVHLPYYQSWVSHQRSGEAKNQQHRNSETRKLPSMNNGVCPRVIPRTVSQWGDVPQNQKLWLFLCFCIAFAPFPPIFRKTYFFAPFCVCVIIPLLLSLGIFFLWMGFWVQSNCPLEMSANPFPSLYSWSLSPGPGLQAPPPWRCGGRGAPGLLPDPQGGHPHPHGGRHDRQAPAGLHRQQGHPARAAQRSRGPAWHPHDRLSKTSRAARNAACSWLLDGQRMPG